jgi:hypothetical protein
MPTPFFNCMITNPEKRALAKNVGVIFTLARKISNGFIKKSYLYLDVAVIAEHTVGRKSDFANPSLLTG